MFLPILSKLVPQIIPFNIYFSALVLMCMPRRLVYFTLFFFWFALHLAGVESYSLRPVQIYGVCCSELMFFESPRVAPLAPAVETSFPGVVKVVHGPLTEAQIIQQLRELAPGKFQWSLLKLNDTSYKVDFPSKEDQVRILKFGMSRVTGTSFVLQFDEWKKKEPQGICR